MGGGQAEGAGGALRVVLDQTFGWAWLGLIGGTGFLRPVALCEAIFDADWLGLSFKMLVRQAGYLGGAAVAASLAATAFGLALGLARHSEGAEETLRADGGWMQQAFGPWLIMGLHAAIIAVGLSARRLYPAPRRLRRSGGLQWPVGPGCREGARAFLDARPYG